MCNTGKQSPKTVPEVLLAIKLNDIETNIMVETQLKEVGKPTVLGDMEVYKYGPFDRTWADLGLARSHLFGQKPEQIVRLKSEHFASVFLCSSFFIVRCQFSKKIDSHKIRQNFSDLWLLRIPRRG